MMPKQVSNSASPEQTVGVEQIRSTWTRQTSCHISSAEQLPQLTKNSSKRHKNFPETDLNSNKLEQAEQSCDQASAGGKQQSHSSDESYTPTSSVPPIPRQSCSGRNVTPKPIYSVHPKTDLAQSLTGMPMPVVPVRQALANTEQCAVMARLGLVNSLKVWRQKGTNRVLDRFYSRLEVVRQLGGRGLVHCREGEVKWIVLGETEDQKAGGGVGNRTRAARRKIRGLFRGEGVGSEMHSKDLQIKESVVVAEKRGTVINNVPHDNINDDTSNSEEEWYRKTTPNEEMPNFKEDGVSIKEEAPTEEIQNFKEDEGSNQTSADGSYFFSIEKMTRSTLNNLVNLGALTISAVAGKATEDEETPHATSTRVLRERQTVETDQDVADETGTCPMCQQEMGMKRLQEHAEFCQG